MRRLLLLTVLVLVGGLSCLFAADWYIEKYTVDVTVGTNAVHQVNEYLDVYFEARHRGIIREIPQSYADYNGMTAYIGDLKCSDPYQAESDNGFLVMRIGSADAYVVGAKSYGIEYKYDLGADMNEGYDEFYFNLIGTEWECPINSVHFAVTVPYQSEFFSGKASFLSYVQADENLHFTSGRAGSTGSDMIRVGYEQSDSGDVTIYGRCEGLGAYEGLTMRLDLPEGWYKGARERWDNRPVMRILAPLLSVVLIALAALVWFFKGKDRIPIVYARFEPPFGFSPMFVGYTADGTVDDKDVISMIYYWADEGLLTIKETKGGKYEFTKLKDIMDYAIEVGKNIPQPELDLFNGFFKDRKVGETVTFKMLEKTDFYKTMSAAKSDTVRYFSGDRELSDGTCKVLAAVFSFLSAVPLILNILRLFWVENCSGRLFVYGFICGVLFLLNIYLWDTFVKRYDLARSHIWMFILRLIPTFLAMIICIAMEEDDIGATASMVFNIIYFFGSCAMAFFGAIIEKRTDYGTQVLEGVLGYREFILKAEISELKMMIEQDPGLYYRTLSYAIVFGLEDKWARKFKGMVIEPPTWYSGMNAFDYYYMSRMARRMCTSIVNETLKSHISSSPGSRSGGSAFRSSGFSGGGFGGGGGRAW